MAVTQFDLQRNTKEHLAQAAKGDMEAFCLVVSELESRLLGQAFALCGNQATAEELAQQTWVEAWKSLARFDHSCRFTTWLYGILLHCHYRILRQRKSRPIPFAFLGIGKSDETEQQFLSRPSESPNPDDLLCQKEGSEEWRRLLESLPEIHREVVLLRYFEEASLEEIAVVTGASLGTVKTRLHHALRKLRKLKLP